jgi:hypothetical protein
MSSHALERRISRKARGGLARYEDIRKDRTTMVVQKPHENRKQVDWLYAYDATSAEI